MYGSPSGSISGVLHLAARRPFITAVVVATAAVVLTIAPTPVPPPPTPVPPAVVTVTAPTPDPTPVTLTTSPIPATVPTFDASCQFGAKAVVTNLCKASLDTVALWLQSNPTKTVVVRGSAKNVQGVRRYLTSGESKFGIAPSRISVTADATTGNTVTIREQ
jgi:hypothetical protein